MKLRTKGHYNGWWLRESLLPGDIIEVPDDLATHLLHREGTKFEAAPTGAKTTREITLTAEGEAYVGQEVPQSRKQRLRLESQLMEVRDKLKEAQKATAEAEEETAKALLRQDTKAADAARKRRKRAGDRLSEAKTMITVLEKQIEEAITKEWQEELDLLAKKALELTEEGAKTRKDFSESLIEALEAAKVIKALQRRAATINSRLPQLSEALGVPSPPVANVQGFLRGDRIDLGKGLDSQIARLQKRLNPPEPPAPEPTVKREKWLLGYTKIPGR